MYSLFIIRIQNIIIEFKQNGHQELTIDQQSPHES